ncbi:MAG: DUF4062 domain-containing protein [Chitinophagaceae bacterium]
MANTSYRIYLSSTFRDLKEYREAILNLIQGLPNKFSVNGMEVYTATNATTLQKCMSDARDCDIYILLIANRYGFIPKNDPDNPDNRSITEREYDAAIESTKNNATKKIWVYNADISNTDVVFPQDDDGPEKPLQQQLLQQFRDKVFAKRIPSRPFTTPQDLVTLVSASIINDLDLSPRTKTYDVKSRYCCDRIQQFQSYQTSISKRESNFQVFISNGNHNDSGGNLANRCAIFSLNIPEDAIIPVALDEIFSGDYELSKSNFLLLLKELIPGYKENTAVVIADFITAINNAKHDTVVMKMNCDDELFTPDKRKFLSALFTEMHTICNQPTLTTQFYFFLTLEDPKEDPNYQPAELTCFKGEIGSQLPSWIHVLSRFKILEHSDIDTWLLKYITRDETQKDDLYDEHFKNKLPASFRMREAERAIRELYKRINEKDPLIANILNL